jgi:hypothetical protein
MHWQAEKNNLKSCTLQQFALGMCWQAKKKLYSLNITEIEHIEYASNQKNTNSSKQKLYSKE